MASITPVWNLLRERDLTFEWALDGAAGWIGMRGKCSQHSPELPPAHWQDRFGSDVAQLRH